jgi:hypothetical protein
MCDGSQCAGCRILTDKIYNTRQVLTELKEKLDAADYSLKAFNAEIEQMEGLALCH